MRKHGKILAEEVGICARLRLLSACNTSPNGAAGEIRAGLGDNCDMHVQVECYAGRKAEERPVRFRLDEHEYTVEEVLDTWYGPEHVFFKIRADAGCLYILRHRTSVPDGDWELVSFREPGRG